LLLVWGQKPPRGGAVQHGVMKIGGVNLVKMMNCYFNMGQTKHENVYVSSNNAAQKSYTMLPDMDTSFSDMNYQFFLILFLSSAQSVSVAYERILDPSQTKILPTK
jgi:hypothetical protein